MHQLWPTSTISQTYFLPTATSKVFHFSVSTGRRKRMTCLCPNPVLQMKRSFWRINFYICRSWHRTSGVTFCAEMKLFGWLKAMLQKGFANSFWCIPNTWSLFGPKSVAFEGKENALIFSNFWRNVWLFKKSLNFKPVYRKKFWHHIHL